MTLGTKCGDIRTAIALIRNGADLSPEIQAHYLSAACSRADMRARQEETDEAAAVLENVATPKSAHTDGLGEAILDKLTKLIGVDEADE